MKNMFNPPEKMLENADVVVPEVTPLAAEAIIAIMKVTVTPMEIIGKITFIKLA
jgi:hypothetical protein